jgi:hypothetical protein
MNVGTLARTVFVIPLFALGCGIEDDPGAPIDHDLRIIGDYDPPPIVVRPPPVAPTSADLKMDGPCAFTGAAPTSGSSSTSSTSATPRPRRPRA